MPQLSVRGDSNSSSAFSVDPCTKYMWGKQQPDSLKSGLSADRIFGLSIVTREDVMGVSLVVDKIETIQSETDPHHTRSSRTSLDLVWKPVQTIS
jgi:hypothetical protein